mmetsp:Transcript_37705/g.107181  ORF Transcript_37705/g.107181 Transcript_37705/m.107181 type:complete len:176 (+) Transcript_37705:98-625(+)
MAAVASEIPAKDAVAVATPTGAGSAPDEMAEVYRELERLELALLQEKQQVFVLTEENAANQEAHLRDIAALEAMLQQVGDDRDRLAAENRVLAAELAEMQVGKGQPIGVSERGKWRDPMGSPSSLAMTEYAPSRASFEDMDRSCSELDNSTGRLLDSWPWPSTPGSPISRPSPVA